MNRVLRPTAIANVTHWDAVWNNTHHVQARSRFNYYDLRLAELFSKVTKPGDRVLEVGCGGSRWIRYFADERRCETWGIDYSRTGLQLTSAANSATTDRPTLVEGDFFDTSKLPSRYFDFVYSLGFIEHFEDPATALVRAYDLLRPGGRIFTLVPNFVGYYGWLQRVVSNEIFRKHMVIDPAMLDRCHLRAGFVPESAGAYVGCFAPGVVNFGRWQRPAIFVLKPIQHAVCWLLELLHLEFESSSLSPYVVGIYRRAD